MAEPESARPQPLQPGQPQPQALQALQSLQPAQAQPPARAKYFATHFRSAMTDADRRADAQRHLESRSERIEAYIASLEVSLATAPSGVAAVVERRLAQARRDLDAATRPQLAVPMPPTRTPRTTRARTRAAVEQQMEPTPEPGT